MYRSVKRVLDVAAATAALVALCPLLAAIAVAVWADSPGGVLFLQERVGQNGRHFVLWKFRTMYRGAPQVSTAELTDAARYVTRTGRWLRKTSLDELPQLINIIKGDMSFVGPRPVIPGEERLLRFRRALGADTVRPGLTGLAQVCGRDRLSVPGKAWCDAVYAHTVSPAVDARILRVTLRRLLTADGVR